MAEGWVHFHKNKLVGFLLCIGEWGRVSWRAAASLCWHKLFLRCAEAVLHGKKIGVLLCRRILKHHFIGVHSFCLPACSITSNVVLPVWLSLAGCLFPMSRKNLVPQNGWLFAWICVLNGCISNGWKGSYWWINHIFFVNIHSVCTSEMCKLSYWFSAEVSPWVILV